MNQSRVTVFIVTILCVTIPVGGNEIAGAQFVQRQSDNEEPRLVAQTLSSYRPTQSVAFSPDRSLLLTKSPRFSILTAEHPLVTLWSIKSGGILWQQVGDPLGFSRQGDFVVLWRSGVVFSISTTSGKEMTRYEGPIIASSGRRVIQRAGKTTLRIVDVGTFRSTMLDVGDEMYRWAECQSCDYLAGWGDNSVIVFELTTGRMILERKWANQRPTDLQFSPDGRKLLVETREREVRLTDTSSISMNTLILLDVPSNRTVWEQSDRKLNSLLELISSQSRFFAGSEYLILQQNNELTIINTQTGVIAKGSLKVDLRIDEMRPAAAGKLLAIRGFSHSKREHFIGVYSLADQAVVVEPITNASVFSEFFFGVYHKNIYAFDLQGRKWIPYPDVTVGARISPSGLESLAKGESYLTIVEERPTTIWEPRAGRVRKLDGIPPQLKFVDVIDSQAMLLIDDNGEYVIWDYQRNANVGRLRPLPTIILRPTIALSPNEKWLAIGTGTEVYLFGLATGRFVRSVGHGNLVAFSRDSRFLIAAVWGGNELFVHDLSKQEPVRMLHCDNGVQAIAATNHPTRILATESEAFNVSGVIDVLTGEKCYRVDGSAAAVSVDGSRICAAQLGKIVVLDSKDGRELRSYGTKLTNVSSLAIDRDGSTLLAYGISKPVVTAAVILQLVVDHRLDAIDIVSGDSRVLRDFPATSTEYHLLFPNEGRRFMAWAEAPGLLSNSTGEGTTMELRESANGKVVSTLAMRGSGIVSSAAFSGDGKLLFAIDSDGVLSLWRVGDSNEVARLFVGSGEHWVITDPKTGRFDSDNLESIPQFRWVAPDEPFEALAPEIFLRDYYQPNLLVSILRGHTLPPLPKLTSRNRLRPDVNIESVTAGANSSSAVVKVRVSRTETSAGVKSDVVDRDKLAAFDLRLFRNGQLVEQHPAPGAEPFSVPEPDPTSPEQLAAWREANRIELKLAGTATLTFAVPLPSRSEPGPVEFTAYCFNEDRVKSDTAHFSYRAAEYTAPHKPRAYVLCVGASDYGNPAFDLSYAADDASAMAKALSADGRLSRYQVVRVVLTADKANRFDTKETLKAALELMAGPTDRGKAGWQEKEKILRAQVSGGRDLSPATPDDLVIVSFSGHGYTDERNEFYLVMPEVGPLLRKGQKPSAEALKRCVSEDELAGWLHRVDAGELALVVDACHSAATVGQSWFKPGPMGSRGLGQLAYDKRMRVLAASQADDFALESASLRHGLLTYALVVDGLDGQKADFQPKDGRVTLGEWLAYGVERVPDLHKRLQEGRPLDDPAPGGDPKKGAVKVVLVDRKGEAPKVVDATAELVRLSSLAKDRAFQTPALFDYARGRQDPTLATPPHPLSQATGSRISPIWTDGLDDDFESCCHGPGTSVTMWLSCWGVTSDRQITD